MAAIWKRKSSLIRLSRLNGYKGDGLKLALRQPWPKAERIIAEFLGVLPQTIWPSRYNADGTSNRPPRGNPNWVRRRHKDHVIPRAISRHVKKAGAN
jgi:Ner family transcriptional regulator